MTDKAPLLGPRVYEERPRGVYIDEHGRECPDPTPVAPPINLGRHPSLEVMVQSLVRGELLRQHALQQKKMTFEEFDDLDIPDDPIDPSTPWENDFDPPIREVVQAVNEERAKAAPPPPPKPSEKPAE